MAPRVTALRLNLTPVIACKIICGMSDIKRINYYCYYYYTNVGWHRAQMMEAQSKDGKEVKKR